VVSPWRSTWTDCAILSLMIMRDYHASLLWPTTKGIGPQCDGLSLTHSLGKAIIHASPEQGETDYLTLLNTTMVKRPAALWPSAAGCPVPAEVLERKGQSQFLVLVYISRESFGSHWTTSA
jgi:hypothetical protein